MPDRVSIEELRDLSARLRSQARATDDPKIKRSLAEAALVLAELAEALSGRAEKE